MKRRIVLAVIGVTLITAAILVPAFFRNSPTPAAAIRQRSIVATGGTADILFVGDTHFGDDYFARREHWQARSVLQKFGYEYPLAKLRTLVDCADHVVANLWPAPQKLNQSV